MQMTASKRWYREPWPWLLMLGPAIVVVAGINLAVVAFRGADGLVADDYYKQGLGINRTLARDAQAAALRLEATLRLDRDAGAVRVIVGGDAGDAPVLTLALRHPTRAAEDRVVPLARVARGDYIGRLAAPPDLAWRVQLEDAAGGWRLAGRWRAGSPSAALGPAH